MNTEVLYQLFEQATTAVVIYQEQRGIIYTNPCAESLTGLKKEHIYPTPLTTLFPSNANEEFLAHLGAFRKSFYYAKARLLLQQHAYVHADLSVHLLSRSSPNQRVFQLNIYPIRSGEDDSNSGPEGRASSEKADTLQLLNVLRKKTDLPLNALDSLLQRLVSMQPRTDQLPLLHSMLQSGQQLKHIVRDILLYAELEYGKHPPAPVLFNLEQFVDELQDTYRQEAAENSNQLTIQGKATATLYIADTTQLKVMLSKLIENALRFTRQGKIRLMVQELPSTSRSSEVQIKFTVADNGIGIEAADLPDVTKAFFSRKAPWENENTGCGLGLSIVQLMANSWGGTLEIVSDTLGTHVHLVLPIQSGGTFSGSDASLTADHHVGKASLKGLRLLYVEDLLPNHFLMEGLCSIWEISLDTAFNGKEALNKLYQNAYDIILMDLNMPVMNGYVTSQKIRETSDTSHRDIPIIALSGSVTPDTRQLVDKCGMNDLLSKPIKPAELLQKLTSYANI
jgi:signal transduction histidine kinase/BarA-like signal transduction histidine kinase